MTNLPNPNIPLLASDQAEVIEMFNDLMRQWRGASGAAEPAGPPSDVRELGMQWGIPGLE